MLMLMGNKSDCSSLRQVKRDEGQKLAFVRLLEYQNDVFDQSWSYSSVIITSCYFTEGY